MSPAARPGFAELHSFFLTASQQEEATRAAMTVVPQPLSSRRWTAEEQSLVDAHSQFLQRMAQPRVDPDEDESDNYEAIWGTWRKLDHERSPGGAQPEMQLGGLGAEPDAVLIHRHPVLVEEDEDEEQAKAVTRPTL
jgi:hypothetical protein